MKENWTDDMKKKLEGHKMAPPSGLWEGISQQMGMKPETAPARKSVALRQWYWAVAAAILAFVGFFAFYPFNQDEPQQQVLNTSLTTKPTIHKEKDIDQQSLALAEKTPQTHAKAIYQAIEEPHQNLVEPNLQAREDTVLEIHEDTHLQAREDTLQQNTEATTKQMTFEETNLLASTDYQAKETSSSSSAGKWSLGLDASGGLLALVKSTTTGRFYSYADDSKSMSENLYPSNYNNDEIYTRTDYVSKHRLPLNFGISLHYQISSRLTLLSGIHYTNLYSEFSIPLYENISYHQRLHYLGIPLGVAWKLWSTGNFHLYISGKTMIEKCISAKVSYGDLNQRPWQWSVNASVGAEYQISRLLGFYLEPSLGYYFDDGTSLEHYYKEHPLAPAIEFGLRLHLSGN